MGRSVQAAVLLIGGERQRRPKLKLARVQLTGSTVEVLEAWRLSRTGEQPENWFWTGDARLVEHAATLLGDVAVVRRGVATGANDVFFLPDAIKEALPPDVSIVAIPTLRHFNDDELSEAAHAQLMDSGRWLLAIPEDYELSGAVADYVERHREAVSRRYLPSQRACWYSINEMPRPQILLSPPSKTDFKVVVNSVRAVPSNNLFGITLKDEGDPGPLACWLRSDSGQRELKRLSHRYPGGSHKLEPVACAQFASPRGSSTRARSENLVWPVAGRCTVRIRSFLVMNVSWE